MLNLLLSLLPFLAPLPLLMQALMAACPAFFNIDVWECSYHLQEVPSSYLPSLISITTRLAFQNRVLLRGEVMEPLLPQHLPIRASGAGFYFEHSFEPFHVNVL